VWLSSGVKREVVTRECCEEGSRVRLARGVKREDLCD